MGHVYTRYLVTPVTLIKAPLRFLADGDHHCIGETLWH